jgi:hypothetical protein
MNEFNEKELVDSMKEAAEIFSKHNRAINMTGLEDYKPSAWARFKWWWEEHNPFNCSLHVATAEEYINMPRHQRVMWGFWYVHCYITGGRVIFGSKKELAKLETFLKTHYPIQWFLREVVYWKVRIAYTKANDYIRHSINPRQRWLTKQIPKCWVDKVNLIPDLNFAMVVHFVEGEEALDVTDWDGTSEKHSQFAKELKDCYDYIKVRRPDLQKQLDNSYPNEETMTGDYHVDYAEHTRLEVLLNKEDTKYLVWIVTNRDYFWA